MRLYPTSRSDRVIKGVLGKFSFEKKPTNQVNRKYEFINKIIQNKKCHARAAYTYIIGAESTSSKLKKRHTPTADPLHPTHVSLLVFR